MTNRQFIEKYGIYEFKQMCRTIPQELYNAKICDYIGSFKINKKTHSVRFYRKNKENVILSFADVYNIGIYNLEKYLGVDNNEKD